MQYRFVGDHAENLESGQPIGIGEYVTLEEKDMTGVNKTLLDDGKLIEAEEVKTEKSVKKEGEK